MNIFHLYILFPQGLDRHINNVDDASTFIKNFQITLIRADCEQGAILYYSSSNKEAFVEEAQVLEELLGFFGILNFEEAINYLLLTANANNWEQNTIHDIEEQYSFYKQWISENRSLGEDVPPTIKEITEKAFRIRNRQNEKSLLLNTLHFFPAKNPISMIKGSNEGDPLIIPIVFVTNFQELDKWFLDNRQQRNYNMEDNRHIENHPSHKMGKSPLLNGLNGKNHAASLLINAVSDQRDRAYLINFDEGNGCYIRFEYENDNPQNLYHGYHLVKPITHERDLVEENKISNRIMSILEHRKEIE